MIGKTRFYFITVLLACMCNGSYSHSANLPHEEAKLVQLYAALINKLGNPDSTTYYSDKFGKELKKYISTTPATLEYRFKRLTDSNYCFVTTSLDGNLRIYSWDTWTGGTMHFFNQIIQYRDGGRVLTKIPQYEKGDPGVYCSAIFTVMIKGAAYYLPISNGISSTKDASQSISVLTIHNHQLVDTVRLFKTKKRLLNAIDVYFDFFSVVDRPERPLTLITYDEKQKVIRIPLVNDNGQVTRQGLLYKLQDDYFTFTGIEPDKRK